MDSTHHIIRTILLYFIIACSIAKIFAIIGRYPPKFQELPKVAEVATKLDLF